MSDLQGSPDATPRRRLLQKGPFSAGRRRRGVSPSPLLTRFWLATRLRRVPDDSWPDGQAAAVESSVCLTGRQRL